MTVEIVRYTYRLRPGAQAERALLAEWHRCRWLWNEAVHQQRTGRRPTWPKLQKMLTAARAANQWLRDGWAVSQQEVLRDYVSAFNQSFKVKGCRRPVAKSRRRSRPSLNLTRRGFSIVDGRLQLPKGTTVPVVWSRKLPSEPSSVRVYRDNLGHWYASFVVRRDVEAAPPAEGGIGIDWGIATPATTTDPAFDLPYAGYRRRCAAELARAQRKMSRRQRPRGQATSRGYQQAKRERARIEKRAARQAQHGARAWAKNVVNNHQFIAVEDLQLKFLTRSIWARKTADIALGQIRRELIERAVRAGRTVVNVAPAYTTQTCSQCLGRTNQALGLAVRVFRCPSCGHTEGRDRNAARTILALAERGQIGVDGVRHTSASPKGVAVGVQPESRIP